MTRPKVLLALLAVLALGLAGWVTLINKPNTTIVVAPSVADITIDGGKKVRQGSFHLALGDHRLSATMDGFSEKIVNFKVAKGQTTRLTVVLIPNSLAGTTWLQTHQQEALRRESLGGQTYDSTSAAVSKKLPLIKELPLIDQLYRVDYGQSRQHPNDPNSVAIYITYYNDTGRQQALDWLKFKGYDPSKLEIIYQNAIGS